MKASRSFSHSHDDDAQEEQPTLSFMEQVRLRISETLHAAQEWMRQIQGHLRIRTIPASAAAARQVLIEEQQALEEQKVREEQCAATARAARAALQREQARLAAEAAAETARIMAVEAQQKAEQERQEQAAAAAVTTSRAALDMQRREHQVATQEAAKATQISAAFAGEPREEKPLSAAKKERRANNAKKNGTALMPDAEWEAQAPARKEKRAQTINAHTRLLVDESSYPIPWITEASILGERPLAKGAFQEPIQLPAPHAQAVGATGRFAAVDFHHPDAWKRLAAIASAQKPKPKKAGRPPKHLGHGVMSKPLRAGEGGIQLWRPDEAMRVARHYLRAQGADPDRHDIVVIIHRDKEEEAIHVLWNRVRDDGKLHICESSFVAAALGRARWDQYAGIDPARISAPDSKEKIVRDGFKAIRDDSLHAVYRDMHGDAQHETIPLIGRCHAAILATEGAPDAGSCAGTWTPKPAYRSEDDIRQILYHCFCEGKR